MDNKYTLPEEIQIQNENIPYQISKNGNIEWRSRKELYNFLNTEQPKEWTILGFVSIKTLKKWGIASLSDMYILAKGRNLFYVYSLGTH